MMEYDVLYKIILGITLVGTGTMLGFLLGASYMFLKMI